MFPRNVRVRIAAVAASLVVPLAAAACANNPSGPGPADRAALVRARAAWAALGADDYTFVVGPRCFCGPPQEIRTTVVDGVAVSRVFVHDGSPVPANQFRTIETVDAMLAHVQKALDDGADELDATYDAHGVPVDVSIDYSRNAADEEFGWGVVSLVFNP